MATVSTPTTGKKKANVTTNGTEKGGVSPNPGNVLPIRQIIAGENLGRYAKDTKGELAAFAESVKSQGILQPLLVQPREDGKYDLVDGFRRLAAARMLKMTEVPVRILDGKKASDPATSQIIAVTSNVARKNLNPVELATKIGELKDTGKSVMAIASMLGMDHSTVSQYLNLRTASPELRKKVMDGYLTFSAALDLKKIEAEYGKVAAEKVEKAAVKLKEEEESAENGKGKGRGKKSDAIQARHVRAAAEAAGVGRGKQEGKGGEKPFNFGLIVSLYFEDTGNEVLEAFGKLYRMLEGKGITGEGFANLFQQWFAVKEWDGDGDENGDEDGDEDGDGEGVEGGMEETEGKDEIEDEEGDEEDEDEEGDAEDEEGDEDEDEDEDEDFWFNK